MRTGRIVLTGAASAVLVILAATDVVWSFRLSAAVLVTALVATGQRWELPTATGAGLLGLVVVVGAGPASAASPLGLVAWVLPAWAVILVAASGSGPAAPQPRDTRTRLRLAAGEVAAVLGALPLVVLAAGGGRPAAVWAAGSGLALVGLLLVATGTARTRGDAATPAPPRG